MVRLTEVFRQAAESRIIVNAHRINQGVILDAPQTRSRKRLLFCRGG
jgi:exodeoxyribonuclease V alpha subunit